MYSFPIKAYVELTKPRIAAMVLVTTIFGFVLASPGSLDWGLLLATLIGTAGAGAGASVLNQYLERDVDGRMERTRDRPLPAGVVSPATALYYGVILATGGVMFLLWQVNLLAAFIALQSTFLYVLVYTPMKRLSWWNTSVGAIPGALPPLIGWAAATGQLSWKAWTLFAILYVWQHPHFFAIAWMYRHDYRRAGFKMLSVVEPQGPGLFMQTVAFSVILVPVSVLPALLGLGGPTLIVGGLVVSLGMLWYGVLFALRRTNATAKSLMRMSLVYLPVLLVLIVVDGMVSAG